MHVPTTYAFSPQDIWWLVVHCSRVYKTICLARLYKENMCLSCRRSEEYTLSSWPGRLCQIASAIILCVSGCFNSVQGTFLPYLCVCHPLIVPVVIKCWLLSTQTNLTFILGFWNGVKYWTCFTAVVVQLPSERLWLCSHKQTSSME